MTSSIALIHLCAIAVPALIAVWTDLSAMRIPNWISVAMLAIFVVVAPLTLPLDMLPGRLLTAGIVFAIGLGLYALGQMGAGDVKFATVVFLFVEPADATFFIRILGVMALAGLLTHRAFARSTMAREMAPHWTSWTAKGVFSYGVALSLSLIYYLLVLALGG
ncbi:Flp pilus assembly protein, protease CpaA [Monaibacterium marinum]|uniref:Flp pilus assembly protein, protease CpaA n=1 Tax=Pontivivens marinum TaxID=1690039 RepID=A0A2C9CU30_9RHOB|nr:prepilin peptidase [Monaibacterium marinum]SOH94723.1 Flp pilus assembly protein, protease CpaA [Monaibacterium marinum]